MSEKSLTTSDFFLVYPGNAKFVSGGQRFDHTKRQKQLLAALCLASVPVAIVIMGLSSINGLFSQGFQHDWKQNFFPIALVLLLVTAAGGDLLISIGRDKCLVEGQFVDGKVVYCHARVHSDKSGNYLQLTITYTFETPAGRPLEAKAMTRRADLWKDVPDHLKGTLGRFRRWQHPEHLQILAPEPGTPLKIRYASDRLFRVM